MKPIDYTKITELKCTICKQVKPVSEYSKYVDPSAPINGWRYYSRCKECNKKLCKEYGIKSRNKRNARLRKWRKNNPVKAKAGDKRKRLAINYGLTESDVNHMIEQQNEMCLLCGRKVKLVIDHDHKTGRVRGLLCTRCNISLGWLETYPAIYDKLSSYLKG